MNAVVEKFEQSETENAYSIGKITFIETLVDQYNKEKNALVDAIEAISSIPNTTQKYMTINGANLDASKQEDKLLHLLKVDFWSTVYQRSQISMFLDSEKRSEWGYKLHLNKDNNADLPEFTLENVTETVKSWYADRENMFMDRVDYVFNSLSKTHVTNQPEGFSKKMIFNNACEESFSGAISINWKTRAKIHDFESLICMITNRPMPEHSDVSKRNLKLGVKYSFLGDSYQLQVFKSGTIHIWVHPSIAIELNTWLAKKYPAAIASKHRVKTKAIKEYEYSYDHLTANDVHFLETIINNKTEYYKHMDANDRFWKFAGISRDDTKNLSVEAAKRLVHVAASVLRNGYPNIKDHQFYPTPSTITQDVTEYLGDRTTSEQRVLEPSAGTGSLASIFPKDIITCVEVNGFFAEVLQSNGFSNVVNNDFLKFSTSEKFDLIVMNPPYSEKRLELHFEKALTLLENDGEIILIAPTGKLEKIKEIAQNRTVEIIKSHIGEFEDTKINTSIFSIT